jgi:hypothetical protein
MPRERIRLRPKNIPQFLYYLENPEERRVMLYKYALSRQLPDDPLYPYSNPLFVANLRELFGTVDTNTRVSIVPSIDDICGSCPLNSECVESDANLPLPVYNRLLELPSDLRRPRFKELLDHMKRSPGIFLFHQVFPFCSLIGQEFSLAELKKIRDSEPEVSRSLSDIRHILPQPYLPQGLRIS